MAAKKSAEEKTVEKEDKAVDSVEDVLQPTGVELGGLEESKEAEEEAKAEQKGDEHTEAKKQQKAEKAKEVAESGNKEAPAEGPFADSNVAGAPEGKKTWGQSAQLYTDGLSGDADSNLDRAYGSGG